MYKRQVQNDITNIFDYIRYQEIFETNGTVDYSKVVLEVSSGPGGDRSYTLNDIITYGKSLGYYLDEADDYALKGEPTELSEEDQQQLYVFYRCYQSEEELTGPDPVSYTHLLQENREDSPYSSWYRNVQFHTGSPLGDSFCYDCWQGHFSLDVYKRQALLHKNRSAERR